MLIDLKSTYGTNPSDWLQIAEFVYAGPAINTGMSGGDTDKVESRFSVNMHLEEDYPPSGYQWLYTFYEQDMTTVMREVYSDGSGPRTVVLDDTGSEEPFFYRIVWDSTDADPITNYNEQIVNSSSNEPVVVRTQVAV